MVPDQANKAKADPTTEIMLLSLSSFPKPLASVLIDGRLRTAIM
jgi:hypothetical protein